MFDYSHSNFAYGNIKSNANSYQYFNAIGVKNRFTKDITLQYGIEGSFSSYKNTENTPVYFYALSSDSPASERKNNLEFHYIEPYVYLNYEVLRNLGISGSVRKNILWDKTTKNFLSYQLSSHYELNNRNRFIISSGKYHSYTTPNFNVRHFALLSSKQMALDYYYESHKININSAVYVK